MTGRPTAPRRRHALGAALLVAASLVAVGSARAAGTPGLPDYPSESDFLAQVPGSSTSGAAGLFNPAAWGASGHGSLFLSYDDASQKTAPTSRMGVLGLKALGFGVRRFDLRDTAGVFAHVTDYTLGFSTGSRGHAVGFAYSWSGGRHDLAPRHERYTLGSITRPTNYLSIGTTYVRDLERSDHSYQADIGIRPHGPRFTIFADAFWPKKQKLFDPKGGIGAEVLALPGVALSGRVREGGSFTIGLTASLARALTVSARPHYDEQSDHTATTFALEAGTPGPSLLRLMAHGQAYPRLTLRGPLAYQRYALFDGRRTLLGTLDGIARAADDPAVGGMVVNLSGAELGLEKAWEIRQQLAGFRAHGKTVTVFVDNASLVTLTLASVADQIWMDPYGELELHGVSTGLTYYRKAFDKLGVGVDELRFFTYKSAAEALSRQGMSEADRRQRQDYIDDVYETATQLIAGARGISRTEWDAVNDTALVLSAPEAVRLRLVDSIGTWQDAERHAPRVALAHPIEARPVAALTGDPDWNALEWTHPPRVAVLYAIGPCDMETGIRARVLSRAIREAADDRRVKAIVLRADSPGGDPLASDVVGRDIRAASRRKPVVVTQGQVAGSGGYWISMYGRPLIASPFTVTGSIGVIDAWLWNKGFGDKIGLTYDGVKRGRSSDLGRGITLPIAGETLPERPLSPAERGRTERVIKSLYAAFVHSVAEGRGLSDARVDEIGQGHFYSGTRGLAIGLVDSLGGLWDGIAIAKRAARIPASHPVALAEGPGLGLFDTSALMPHLIGTRAPRAETAAEPVTIPMSHALVAFVQRVIAAGGKPLVLMEPLEMPEILEP